MPSPDPSTLPFRPCVGIVVLNADRHVWIGRRIPKPHDENDSSALWQMPQGGIDAGEAPDVAALRELEEETGICSVEIIAETPAWLNYDLPAHLVGRALGGRYRGQTQKWFAVRFTGDEREIDISDKPHQVAEFDAWRWAPARDLPKLIVPFKREIYRSVLATFADLVADD